MRVAGFPVGMFIGVVGAAHGCSSSARFTGGQQDGGAPALDGSFSAQGDTGGGRGLGGHDARPDVLAPRVGCDPSCVAAGGSCKTNVCVISENPGGLDPTIEAALKGGGKADSAFTWLYPYDKTVFPRGLLTPTLQFGGAPIDAAYVHIASNYLTYDGFYGASNPPRVSLSQAVWNAITIAASGADTVKVEVTKSSAGMATGPATEVWTIAAGNVQGTIYYETYRSAIIMGLGDASTYSQGVGLMQIKPGATQPVPLKAGCGNVCHAVSADGSTLVASVTQTTSSSYDLKNGSSTIHAQSDESFTYGGLYPDGSLLMSATEYRLWDGQSPSRLYDTKTGMQIPAAGWDGVMSIAPTASFSPNGKQIAFNHFDTGMGHSLAVMDFDLGGKAFSNLIDVVQDPNLIPGWPAFTPDSASVVYQAGPLHLGPAFIYTFETDNFDELPSDNARADLYRVDVASHAITRLDSLDGYGVGGTPYLPANDPGLNFAPTTLPLPVGGYYWIVFTSHRAYGNMLASEETSDQDGKLWVAAIDPTTTAGADSSHPAFYLDGQELSADNYRGYWVLDPCEADGASCNAGDQCCGGYCASSDDSGPMACSSAASSGCSQQYDKCATAADCCGSELNCVNGYCAEPLK